MNTLVQLKTFCKENDLEFPKFNAMYSGTSLVRYSVVWYSFAAYTSEFFSNDDEAIKNCVLYLNEWLKSEKNFLNLLEYESSCKMNVVV